MKLQYVMMIITRDFKLSSPVRFYSGAAAITGAPNGYESSKSKHIIIEIKYKRHTKKKIKIDKNITIKIIM
jgi:hypothetical protein